MSTETSLWQRHDIGAKVVDVLKKMEAHEQAMRSRAQGQGNGGRGHEKAGGL